MENIFLFQRNVSTSHHLTSLLVYRDNAAQLCFARPHSLHATQCTIHCTSHHLTSLLVYRDNAAQFYFACLHLLHATQCTIHCTSHHLTSLLVYRDNAAQLCFARPHSLHATRCIIQFNVNPFFLSIFDFQHHHHYYIDSIIHCLTNAFIHFIKQVVQHGEESISEVVISCLLHVVTSTLEM